MKKILIILLYIGLITGVFSCQDMFLEKPNTTGTVNLDLVFSNTKNAEAALFNCYRNALRMGWPQVGFYHGVLGGISGETSKGYNWHGIWAICESGLLPTGAASGADGGAEVFAQYWQYIRACYIVKENIDKVVDMDQSMKEFIKGEATALVAYRYMGLLCRYGGVPIVKRSYLPDEDLAIPRSTVQETLDFIIELCDEAYAKLPNSWDNIDAGKYTGRITKGVPLAIKARALMYGARPLFNSATPYINFGANNNLICLGNEDASRWQAAIKANEEVLTWAAANGKALIFTAGPGNRNTKENAALDYATACSEFNNRELILSYKDNSGGTNQITKYYNNSNYQQNEPWDTDNTGMLTNFLENYYDEDGNEMDWPRVGDPAPRPASEWINNINKIEARFRVDMCVTGMGSWANPNDNRWQPQSWGKNLANYETRAEGPSRIFPGPADVGKGCGFSTKYYYRAGSRMFFEPPLFRLAETYLNLAEAYNEAGDPVNALKNLNMVHNRAGLPSITETNKDLLRRIIWREKSIEYFNENHRYHDAKHWKHPDIATNIHGGQKRELQFRRNASGQLVERLVEYWDANAYVTYWHPRMFLEPFPQGEVNKGIIIQNPGY